MSRPKKYHGKQAAHHEAAHAVVFVIGQLVFTNVEIHRNRKEAKKHNRWGYLAHEYETLNIREAAAMCISSYASISAEQLADENVPEFYLSLTACEED